MKKQFSLRKELPTLSPLGFEIIKCPDNIFNPILDYYHYRKKLSPNGESFSLYDNPKFCKWLVKSLTPIYKQWAQLPIELSHLWGIERYKKGDTTPSTWDYHISHHLSSQIIVFQDKEWAFNIWGYDYKLHTVYANPGDIILYEGAKRNHSRLLEYQGNNYDLIYLSYKFKDYKFVKKDLDT